MKATIIDQSSTLTIVKCPKCRSSISLFHGNHTRGVNDMLGRLDLGHQNYHMVVCMNQDGGRYCDFMKDFSAKDREWL